MTLKDFEKINYLVNQMRYLKHQIEDEKRYFYDDDKATFCVEGTRNGYSGFLLTKEETQLIIESQEQRLNKLKEELKQLGVEVG